jgi:hypothetical protein
VLRRFYDFHLEAGTGTDGESVPVVGTVAPAGRVRITIRWIHSLGSAVGQITARRDTAINLGIPTFTEAAGRATDLSQSGQIL